ncbi:MAG: hypothetical protein M3Y54_15620 [Bacteroidota bacterium]|nr:hypothetical protein [Bacteroidota bacterium]
MQPLFIDILAAITSAAAVGGLFSTWRKLTKATESGPLVVTRKGTSKSVVLPKEYSHEAVRELCELVA